MQGTSRESSLQLSTFLVKVRLCKKYLRRWNNPCILGFQHVLSLDPDRPKSQYITYLSWVSQSKETFLLISLKTLLLFCY